MEHKRRPESRQRVLPFEKATGPTLSAQSEQAVVEVLADLLLAAAGISRADVDSGESHVAEDQR